MHCKCDLSIFTLSTLVLERSLYFVLQNMQSLEVYTNLLQEVNLVRRARMLKFIASCLFTCRHGFPSSSKFERISYLKAFTKENHFQTKKQIITCMHQTQTIHLKLEFVGNGSTDQSIQLGGYM